MSIHRLSHSDISNQFDPPVLLARLRVELWDRLARVGIELCAELRLRHCGNCHPHRYTMGDRRARGDAHLDLVHLLHGLGRKRMRILLRNMVNPRFVHVLAGDDDAGADAADAKYENAEAGGPDVQGGHVGWWQQRRWR